MRTRIVLLEDNLIDSLLIKMLLSEAPAPFQYELIKIFDKVDDLLNFLKKEEVDLIISDVLDGNKATMGLDLLHKLQGKPIPVILVSNSQDAGVFAKIIESHSIHYLMKPLQAFTLYSTIEKVLDEYRISRQLEFIDKKYISLTGLGGKLEPVLLADILFVNSEKNNCFIHTKSKKKYMLKKSLSKLLAESLGSGFLRIHQKYAINTMYISSFKQTHLVLNEDIELPVGQHFRKSVLSFLKT